MKLCVKVEGSPRVNASPSSSSSTWPEMSNKSNPVSLLPHHVCVCVCVCFVCFMYVCMYVNEPLNQKVNTCAICMFRTFTLLTGELHTKLVIPSMFSLSLLLKFDFIFSAYIGRRFGLAISQDV